MNTPNIPIGIVRRAIAKFVTMQKYDVIIAQHRRSEASDEALIADFMRCNVPRHPVLKDNTYQSALKLVTDMFQPPNKYRPVHYLDLKLYPWTVNTSVEAPFSTDPETRRFVRSEFEVGNIPDINMNFRNLFTWVFSKNRPIVHLIKEGQAKGDKFFYWNTAHARAHLVTADDPDKIRMVHGVPKLMLQVELMLLWPYINWLRKGHTPIAWGYETLNGGMYRIMNEASSSKITYQTWLCLDWRMFDKLTRFDIITDVHDIWRSFMDCGNGYIPTVDHRSSSTNAERILNLWNWMSRSVRFTPIRLPDGSEWKRSHATLASGLLQTQVLGSWLNAIILLSCLQEMNISVEGIYLKVLGDDSIIGIKELIPEEQHEEFLDRLAAIASRRFGATLNTKKSRILNSLNGTNFLGYVNTNGLPMRREEALLAQLAYPERSWTIDKLAARAIGIAWASCGQSEVVYNICKDTFEFCVSVGASPDPTGISWMDYLNISTDIDVTQFPTQEEITNRLLSTSTSVRNDTKFWNPDYFLSEF